MSSIEETRTIQEAIKQEAKKFAPTTSKNQKALYVGEQEFSEKEFLLPGKVYGSNFQKPAQSCYEIPDGFVTPLRSTPHRHHLKSHTHPKRIFNFN